MAGALVRWCVARCEGGGWASLGGRFPALRGASGVRRCPSPGRPSSGAGSQGSATHVSRVRSMRACGPSTGPTACALAGRRCSLWGWLKGVPGGGAFHRCGGRLVSGAVPSPTARPLERAARVPRPVCPGCGRCGRVDPAPVPQRAPIRAGVVRCGGGGRASPGGGVFHRCEGRPESGAVPPPAARPPERAARVPRPVCPGCGRCGRGDPALAPRRAPLRAGVARREFGGRASPGGAFHRCEGRLVSGAVPPLAARPPERAARVPRPACPGCGRCGRVDPAPAPQRAPLRAGVARCGGGGRTSPGGPSSTIVRGAWCQALSLPQSSVLWSGQPGFRVPGLPGAVGAGVGTQHRPHSACALAGRRCSPWGWRRGVPGGGAFHRCEGRPVSGAVPPLAALPPERAAARVPRPVCPGCGRCGRVDPAPVPQRPPLRAGVARCGGGGRASPGGGVLSTVARGAWCQVLSLPWPPVLWSGQPGFRVPRVPAAVDVGVWTQHRPHSVRPCGPALPAVGVAEGRPRGGAFHRCEGRLVSGAVPPPAARPPERAARVPRPVCPGCGRCGRVDPAPAPQNAPLRAGVARCGGGGRASPGGVPSTVVRGAWCQALSLPRPLVLRSVQPGFRDPHVPGTVDAGVWTQHRPHSVRPCGPTLLAVGVAEGRPRGGRLPPL